jgi:hypothetical protein
MERPLQAACWAGVRGRPCNDGGGGHRFHVSRRERARQSGRARTDKVFCPLDPWRPVTDRAGPVIMSQVLGCEIDPMRQQASCQPKRWTIRGVRGTDACAGRPISERISPCPNWAFPTLRSAVPSRNISDARMPTRHDAAHRFAERTPPVPARRGSTPRSSAYAIAMTGSWLLSSPSRRPE